MRKGKMFLISVLASIFLLVTSSVVFATTCDGTHVHSSDFSGLHIPCSGIVYTDINDYSKKIYSGILVNE